MDQLLIALQSAARQSAPAFSEKPSAMLAVFQSLPEAPEGNVINFFAVKDDCESLIVDVDLHMGLLKTEADLLDSVKPISSLFNLEATFSGFVESDSVDGRPLARVKFGVRPDTTISEVARVTRAVACIALVGGHVSPGPLARYRACLATGGDSLLGMAEDETFDAKRAPYDFSSEPGKFDYAVDIASFANGDNGGLIAIGVSTRRDAFGRDVVCDVRGCDAERISNLQGYTDHARNRIVPPIEGLRIELVPTGGAQHIVAIIIPPQPGEMRPLLVRGVAVASSKISLTGITIPVRRMDGKTAMTAEAIHSLIVAGRTAALLGRRF